MELRHLRYFLAVAEELHFGRAAEKLYIAQPPLSQQIQHLERELGVPLFVRNSRRVALTPAGEALREEAPHVLARLEQAVARTQRAGRGEEGWLGIGFVASATHGTLPRILRPFRQQFPHVDLGLYEMTTAAQTQALREKRIHVGFARPRVEDWGIQSETILWEPIVVALPDGHAFTALAEIPLAVLAPEPFIAYPRYPTPSYMDWLVHVCEEAGFTPRVTQETGQMQTALSLIAAGLGVALVPATVQNLRRDGVVYRPLQAPAPTTALTLAYREDDTSPVLARFLETARAVCGA